MLPVFVYYFSSDNLTGRKGEELVFDELPREAEKVMHQTDTSPKVMWKRGQERGKLLTDTNGALTISDFSSSDAGNYLVLNSSGGILNTVTVKGENSHSQKILIIHTEIIYTVRVWDNSQMVLFVQPGPKTNILPHLQIYRS